MIKILINKDNETIKSIKVTGHANSNEYGKDLVCAGISTVCMGICNTLDHRGFLDSKNVRIDLSEGNMEIEVLKDNDIIQVILETCIIMFKSVQEASNPKFIKIMEEN